MTDLQELIDMARQLSDRLEKAAYEERRFSVDIQIQLENLSFEIFRTANEINEIKQYIA